MRFILCMLAAFAVCPLFGEAQSEEYALLRKRAEEGAFVFVLPIDHTVQPLCSLAVTVPKKYKPLQPLESFSPAQSRMIEFIPESENDPYGWSEIITINKYLGSRTSADLFMNRILRSMISKMEECRVLVHSSSKEGAVEEARFLIQYKLRGQQEVLGVVYFSGPYDCVGMQYTVRPKAGQSVADAVFQVEAFLKKNCQKAAMPKF